MDLQNADFLRWKEAEVLTPAQREELCALTDPEEINDRFYRTLAFGTAGLRGVMGMGLNRMNEYIIRQATTAFAQVILEDGLGDRGVCICYDCRLNSDLFAREAARVMRCMGIPVWLFRQCRPTPQLSFAVRHFGAAAGINVTASHNPKAYNGYKVYGPGGAQLPTHMADRVAQKMAGIDPLAPAMTCDTPASLTWLEEDFDELYINAVLRCAIAPELLSGKGDDLKIVYSAFHGVGGFILPEVMKRAGLEQLIPVPEQLDPDGTFPTVASPNPEDPAGFAMAVALAKATNAHLCVGTDPDSDRVGIVVRDRDGEYVPVSGNRTGALLLHYILTVGEQKGLLPEHPALIKTIVTSPLPQIIAEDHGCACFNTFTGFKYMAEQAARLEEAGKYRYVMAYEESYGYMIGDHARDKDGVVAALLLCEMAAWYHHRGMTVLDGLEELFGKYGCFSEHTLNVMLPGQDGMERMSAIMSGLRAAPPDAFGSFAVTARRDYQTGLRDQAGETFPMELKGSNVLFYELEKGQALVIRPSGTEPKIKIYALMRGDDLQQTEQAAADCAAAAREHILAI